MLKQLSSLVLGIVWLVAAMAQDSSAVAVSDFSREDLSGWETESFKGETDYRFRNGTLCAQAVDSASGLYRQVEVDLQQTPVLEWSWRVTEGLRPRDERTKAGDDYPARVYVVFSGGIAFWRTRAINYVWSSSQAKDDHWPNAFTANAQMIAVQSGTQMRGEWVKERRNVRKDYAMLFGGSPSKVDAVAIMTDTDNGGGTAAACYGDLRFIDPEQ